jgi:hypothetical protein
MEGEAAWVFNGCGVPKPERSEMALSSTELWL